MYSLLNIHFSVCLPCRPVDIIWAMMIVSGGSLEGQLSDCAVLYTRVVHTHMWAVLKDECWFSFRFRFFVRLFRFSILCVFWFSLDYFVLVTGSIARSANLPVFRSLRGRFWGFSPRRGHTLHRWGWNLAWRRGPKVPSSMPNFTPIGATTRV